MQGGKYPYITFGLFEVNTLKQPVIQKLARFMHESRKISFLFSSIAKMWGTVYKNSVFCLL